MGHMFLVDYRGSQTFRRPMQRRMTQELEEDLSSTKDFSNTLYSRLFTYNTKKRDVIFQIGMACHYKPMPHLMGSLIKVL